MGWLDIALRLGSAMLIGGAIGLNRDLHHKPTGMRTLGLVALGSTLAVLAVAGDPAAVSRVVQGIITGIGFLGAGVILHRPTGGKVHGLTTAASIWVTAAMGVLCGMGAWPILVVGVSLVLLLLVFGGPFEKWCHKRLGSDDDEQTETRSSAKVTG
jgi:putative Mg2+ transporter-C (MgtC) family protein